MAVDPRVALTWIERVADGSRERVQDEVAIEEPLEIRVDGKPLAVTMRTPGHDDELAAGFLAGEGLIGGPADVAEIGLTEDLAANTIAVRTASGLRRDPADERRFHLSSSCGGVREGSARACSRGPAVLAAGPLAPRGAAGGAGAARCVAPRPGGVRAHRRPARHGVV